MLIGALEAGGTKMVCSIGNPEGGVLQRASFPTLTPDVTIPQIVDFIGKFDVMALGIGSFGPLDLNPASPTYGWITKTPKTEWIDYPLLNTLQEALGVPTGIDTDVNAAALAEHTMGAGKGLSSLLYVTVGTGIGRRSGDQWQDGAWACPSGDGTHDSRAAGGRLHAGRAYARSTGIVWRGWRAAPPSKSVGGFRQS